jgi:hypothetical protein
MDELILLAWRARLVDPSWMNVGMGYKTGSVSIPNQTIMLM